MKIFQKPEPKRCLISLNVPLYQASEQKGPAAYSTIVAMMLFKCQMPPFQPQVFAAKKPKFLYSQFIDECL
ncbi:hypothetical protein DSO57_1016305, partial [Entomophthora muscae]